MCAFYNLRDYPASQLLTTEVIWVQNGAAGVLNEPSVSTPSNPVGGYYKLYFKSDGFLYSLNSSGIETKIGGSASQTPWTSDIDGAGYNLLNAGRGVFGQATDDLNTTIQAKQKEIETVHILMTPPSTSGFFNPQNAAFAHFRINHTYKIRFYARYNGSAPRSNVAYSPTYTEVTFSSSSVDNYFVLGYWSNIDPEADFVLAKLFDNGVYVGDWDAPPGAYNYLGPQEFSVVTSAATPTPDRYSTFVYKDLLRLDAWNDSQLFKVDAGGTVTVQGDINAVGGVNGASFGMPGGSGISEVDFGGFFLMLSGGSGGAITIPDNQNFQLPNTAQFWAPNVYDANGVLNWNVDTQTFYYPDETTPFLNYSNIGRLLVNGATDDSVNGFQVLNGISIQDGTYYSAFNIGTQGGNLTYTLPTALGGAGSALIDAAGDGVLSWGSVLLNPMTTVGDIIFENSTPAPDRLAGETSTTKKYLQSVGDGMSNPTPPSWQQVDYADLSGTPPTLDTVADGSTRFAIPTALTLDNLPDGSTRFAIPTALNLDNLPDGTTYGRPTLTQISDWDAHIGIVAGNPHGTSVADVESASSITPIADSTYTFDVTTPNTSIAITTVSGIITAITIV